MSQENIINKILPKGKGLLAVDESNNSINKKFANYDISQDEEHRRQWRELLFTTQGMKDHISAVILFDETARQFTTNGTAFLEVLKQENGIICGIKVDKGLERFETSEKEQQTMGIDVLATNIQEYKKMGFEFTKWRSVFFISENTPSNILIEHNTNILAKYAKCVVDAGMVPILEPEILIQGSRTIQKTKEVMSIIFDNLFTKLELMGVMFESVILKTSFVIPGLNGPHTDAVEIGKLTVDLFSKSVPKNIGGIVFLSGGLSSNSSFKYLESVSKIAKEKEYKVPITFCYSRALQLDAMKEWNGNNKNIQSAQKVFKNKLEQANKSLVS